MPLPALHMFSSVLLIAIIASEGFCAPGSIEEVVYVPASHQHEPSCDGTCNCVSPIDRARIEDALRNRLDARAGGAATLGGTCATPHPRYQFFPMGTRWCADGLVSNFNDLVTGVGLGDFMCGPRTYDGHDATDKALRGFGEQLIGVPVFAALDGEVIAAHDGEYDMQTSWQGQPANFVIIDHGAGRVCYYWHLKKDSVSVVPGQHVVAGQQIGLVGSSGNSTGPHLHFGTIDHLETYESFSGPCHPEQSAWYEQPTVPTNLYLWDCGFWAAPFTFSYPYPPPRTGTLPFGSTARKFWVFYVNHPNQPIRRLRTIRPDGTLAAQAQFQSSFGASIFQASVVDVPFHPDLNLITGEWKLELSVNGVVMIVAPFQVVAQSNPAANVPPEPIAVHLEPEAPRQDQVVVCEVDTSLTLDDRDYDIVRYRYVWSVNGRTVRDIVSAGQADVLPRTYTTPGASIFCAVTPSDGKDDGPTAEASIVVVAGTFDCNGSGVDDAIEIADGIAADSNANLVPDVCETTVLYVNASATGDGSGLSWKDAFVDLVGALRAANGRTDGKLVEIWVAQGTYRPDEGCGDRNASFWLVPNTRLLGGFAGTETSVDERDPAVHVTILSGDLNGDDVPNRGNRSDNSYNVVLSVLDGPAAILDGFHVRGGNADAATYEWGRGGGLFGFGGSTLIRRCTFEDNASDVEGGAVYLESNGSPRFEQCRFVGNRTQGRGGAVRVAGGSAPDFASCVFESNQATAEGGAVSVSEASASLAHCHVMGNDATQGGALSAVNATVSIVNSVIAWNAAGTGGAISGSGSTVAVRSATIAHNSAATHTIALGSQSQLTLANSILWANAGASVAAGPQSSTAYCITQSPMVGMGNVVGDPLFVDAAAADFRLADSSPAIDSGSVALLPVDELDIDGDGDFAEEYPRSLDGHPRRVDAIAVQDSGEGASPIVDRGAYEYINAQGQPADLNGDGHVGGADLAILLGAWGGSGLADLTSDGQVDAADLAILLGAWSA